MSYNAEYHRKYYAENREKSREYYAKNKENRREYWRKYCAKRRAKYKDKYREIRLKARKIKWSIIDPIIGKRFGKRTVLQAEMRALSGIPGSNRKFLLMRCDYCNREAWVESYRVVTRKKECSSCNSVKNAYKRFYNIDLTDLELQCIVRHTSTGKILIGEKQWRNLKQRHYLQKKKLSTIQTHSSIK